MRAFRQPDHRYLLELYFSAVAGKHKSESGKGTGYGKPVNTDPVLPGPAPIFKRIGLAIGYWGADGPDGCHPVAGMYGQSGNDDPGTGKNRTGNGQKDDRQVNGAFYHVHWYKYPLTYWLNIITSAGCLMGGDMDIGYISEIDPTWTDSSLTTILNPEAVILPTR